MKRTQLGLTGVTALTFAQAADAHIVASRLGDFYAGALHPLTDLQDIVLWIATGLLAGSMGAARGRWLVLVVPAGSLVGFYGGLALGMTSVAAVMNAALMILLGLLIATAVRVPTIALCLLALGTAVVRGAANAGGVAADTNRMLFAAGLTLTAYAAITLIMALVVTFPPLRSGWRGIAVRICGSWIAAIGLMIGAFALLPHRYAQERHPTDIVHTSADTHPPDAS
jgi:urease accessory protein